MERKVVIVEKDRCIELAKNGLLDNDNEFIATLYRVMINDNLFGSNRGKTKKDKNVPISRQQ